MLHVRLVNATSLPYFHVKHSIVHETLNHWLTYLSTAAPVAFAVLAAIAALGSFTSARRNALKSRASFAENAGKLREYAETLALLRRGALSRPEGDERAAILQEIDEADAQIAEWRAKLEDIEARLKRAERWVFLKSPVTTEQRIRSASASATDWFWEALANRELPTTSDASNKRTGEVSK